MLKSILFACLLFAAGCTPLGNPITLSDPTSKPSPVPGLAVELPDLGSAPELENELWLNTEKPLRLESLRGKVVLLDMWTFG